MWFLRLSSIRLFTLISLGLVALTMFGTGYALSGFFRQALIDREGKIIADFTRTAAMRELVPSDLENFADPEVQAKLARVFSAHLTLSEVVHVKVFDHEAMIVWSDESPLIGSRGARPDNIARALRGATTVVFYRERETLPLRGAPTTGPVVEFYVPFQLGEPIARQPGKAAGVVSIYRSAEMLNDTINRGVHLVWGTVAMGGIVLYLALFALFNSVQRRQRRAETKFLELSSEHERIVQLEKQSAVGAMIGEIAHQINNPLVGVVNLTELAEREADRPERVREILGDIRRAGRHCHDFVRRMLDFSKLARSECHPTDMGRLIDETVTLFHQTTGGKYRVETGPPAAACLIVDPTLVRHALFNLLTNAAQAGGESGTITVGLGPAGTPDEGWVLTVADQGPGVVDEVRARLFDPFFTTRSGGVGLGLSVVRHIAVLHGGAVDVRNRPGGGAEFAIRFPDECACPTK